MQFLIFNLEKNKYAIDIDDVNEIIENKIDVKKIPNTKEYIEGVSNIRGDIIEIINLSEYLNMNESKENTHIVITGQNKNKKGLIVDCVEQIIDEMQLVTKDVKLFEENDVLDKVLINKENEDIYLQLNLDELTSAENKEVAI